MHCPSNAKCNKREMQRCSGNRTCRTISENTFKQNVNFRNVAQQFTLRQVVSIVKCGANKLEIQSSNQKHAHTRVWCALRRAHLTLQVNRDKRWLSSVETTLAATNEMPCSGWPLTAMLKFH